MIVKRFYAGILVILVLAFVACGGPARKPPQPRSTQESPASIPAPRSWSEEGVASWYGEPFHGRKTANGETYDMNEMTAAHRTLPFGTVLRVTNRNNGRKTQVRVNDRGPFVKNRIIDLSRAAAQDIDMTGTGTAPVLLEIVKKGAAIPGRPMMFVFQVGAFSVRENAERLAATLMRTEGHVSLTAYGELWRVRVGPFTSEENARMAQDRLAAQGYEGFVVAED